MSSGLIRAIEMAGSEAKLAGLIKQAGFSYSQVAINRAKRLGRVSAEMALAVHRALEGRVPASEIRPDLWRRPEDVPEFLPGDQLGAGA
jgi:DNA-binding transcriptional regulator YdaS (Cro superfamily)